MAGPKYASAKYSIAQCDRCNFRYKLKDLRTQTLKTKPYKVKVCKTCWDPDHPQLQLGMYPVYDPQAVEGPRPDNSYLVSGQSGLGTDLYDPNVNAEDAFGFPEGGSRVFQWGWYPVGGSRLNDDGLTPNDLVAQCQIGAVTVTTT